MLNRHSWHGSVAGLGTGGHRCNPVHPAPVDQCHDNIFRDEMYYLAAAQHLDFGYVEFPPFVALVAAFSRAVVGETAFAIRLLSALAGAIIVLLTANITAVMGGGLAAQALQRSPSHWVRPFLDRAGC